MKLLAPILLLWAWAHQATVPDANPISPRHQVAAETLK